MNIPRLYNTVRHLKPCQILGQIQHRIRSVMENPTQFSARQTPDFPGCRWSQEKDFLPPGIQANERAVILAGRMTFINRTEKIGWPPEWNRSNLPKLWQYNLHYFDWLWTLDYEEAKTVALDWIVKHRLEKGQVGWESYPISLRLMNWCGVFMGRHRTEIEKDQVFLCQLWQSVYLQCQWLTGHLETRLLGNHYFENAAALAFAGTCFKGEPAQHWLDRGLSILQKQIPVQILPDGMHFELSPMYHSRILYLLAILHATEHPALQTLAADPMDRMALALKHVCHPDGRIALFNDSALGIYNEPGQLLGYCGRLLERDYSRQDYGCFALPDAGYYGWRDDSGNYLVCDEGKIGPDYIPGHAHADMLSFEMSLAGHRVIVDTGVHDYEVSEARRYFRSTSAHNTVEINGQDQCEMWGAFRVGRRGYPTDVRWQPSAEGFRLEAAHNGYRHLSGAPIHRRIYEWNQADGLKVVDRIESSRVTKVKSRIHFHPDCKVEKLTETEYESKGENSFKINVLNDCRSYLETSGYHPEFGLSIARQTLVVESPGQESGFCIGIGR
ncbi:MAG: alginate lyase family protein [Victivallales bacterium]